MMDNTSAPRPVGFSHKRNASAARLLAGREVSVLALGRSLGWKVLPGFFAGCVLVAVPENQLGAAETRHAAPHVRIVLQPDPDIPAPVSRQSSAEFQLHPAKQDRAGAANMGRVPERGFGATFTAARLVPKGQGGALGASGLVAGPDAMRDDALSSVGVVRADLVSSAPPGMDPRRLGASKAFGAPADLPEAHQGRGGGVPGTTLRSVTSIASSGAIAGKGSAAAFLSIPAIGYASGLLDTLPGEPDVTFGNALHSLDRRDPAATEAFPSTAPRRLAHSDPVRPPGRHRLPAKPVGLIQPVREALRPEEPELPPAGVARAGFEVAISPEPYSAGSVPRLESGDASATLVAEQPGTSENKSHPIGPGDGPAAGLAHADQGALGAAELDPGSMTRLMPAVAGNTAIDEAGDTAGVVRLGALVDLLKDRFQPEEFERLRRSPALDTEVPLNVLEEAGVSLASVDGLGALINTAGMQAAPDGAAGVTRSGEGGSTGGFLGLRQNLTATASAGFDSNPFLRPSEGASAASIRVQLVPSLSRSSERNTFRLSGRAEHIEYLGRYASLQNYGADLAASHRANERLEIEGGLLFNSSVLATNLANPFFVDDLAPDAPLPPTGNDITILGQGQRRTQFGADAGLTYTLSERDQLRWTLTGRADRFDRDGLIESNFIGQQLQYSRQLDEGLSIGALVDASLIDFIGTANGSARTITPQLQVRAALSPGLEVTGSVGLAITRLEFGALEDTTTAFAGNVSLCNRRERSNLCINGSRQVLPAAIGGALLQTSVGLSYSLRVSERDTLQISGSYATASQPVTNAIGPNDFESVNGFVRYERRLDERLRLFVSGGYLNTTGNIPGGANNVQGLVGITFDLGRSR